MSSLSLETTVGQLVAERPARSRVFERYRIDYCCGGKIALDQACARRKVDPSEILQALDASDRETPEGETDWTLVPLGELIENIVSTHHAYLREELPRLSALVTKVARVHGEAQAELPIAHQVFEGLCEELEAHMAKEERILFPYCQALEETAALPDSPFGTVGNPIRMMEHEHADAGLALERLRALTGGYTPPPGACNSYRAMLDGLRTIEQDLHRHIHKENNILFPRAIALEGRLAGTAP